VIYYFLRAFLPSFLRDGIPTFVFFSSLRRVCSHRAPCLPAADHQSRFKQPDFFSENHPNSAYHSNSSPFSSSPWLSIFSVSDLRPCSIFFFALLCSSYVLYSLPLPPCLSRISRSPLESPPSYIFFSFLSWF